METNNKKNEKPPYQCKLCGVHEITETYNICQVCGWEDDGEHLFPDEEGGANVLSFNQYKSVWINNKEKIKNYDNVGRKAHLVERLFAEEGGKKNDGSRFVPDHELPRSLEQELKSAQEIEKLKRDWTPHEIEKTRKKALIVRNEFEMVGKYKIPLIRKQGIDPSTIDVMGYVRAKVGDTENTHKTLHFVTHDWNFETIWAKPEAAMEKLGQYYALCSPDFSIYWDMPPALQIQNTFRNRWCGAYWQSLGAKVIPTVAWGDETSWEYCFDGVEQGSVVFVTNYHCHYPDRFMAGFNKMLEVIKPSTVIVYGEKYPGMKGNIKVISPYDMKEGVDKLGSEEYALRFFKGEVYPK